MFLAVELSLLLLYMPARPHSGIMCANVLKIILHTNRHFVLYCYATLHILW